MNVNFVLRGAAKELVLKLEASAAIRVGRSSGCDLVVQDPTVSRVHAEIRMESERLILLDLDSTNGTFVNDVRTEQEVVNPGDRIRLGSAEIEMCLDPTFPEGNGETAEGENDEKIADDVLFGVAENLSPVDLVQVLAHHGKSGTLMLYNGQFGRIDFQNGHACYAKVNGILGEKAFHRILGWGGAEFQFRKGHPKQVNIEEPLERMLVDSMRLQGEYQRLLDSLPDPQSELTLVPSSPNVELSPIEEEVARAAREAKTLMEVMDVSPYLDFEVAKAMSRLLELRILVPNRVRPA